MQGGAAAAWVLCLAAAGVLCLAADRGGVRDAGRRHVAEVADAGIVVGLARVGPLRPQHASALSQLPFAYPHVAPAGLNAVSYRHLTLPTEHHV